ncbi:MAG: hypothetical protein EBT22_11535 [Chloroflexi bacterium]|nr:hypothetical protein [Chloroflexota bacterium]
MTSETPSPRLAGDLSDQAYTETRAPYFRKPVTRLLPTAGMSARELFVVAHGAGGPLRTLSEVYLNWEHMLSRTNQAAWLAIAGAYVPFGLGETLCAMMRMRAFDVLVTTPAQLTHDLTEVRGLRHYHGEESANDNELQRLDINRVNISTGLGRGSRPPSTWVLTGCLLPRHGLASRFSAQARVMATSPVTSRTTASAPAERSSSTP